MKNNFQCISFFHKNSLLVNCEAYHKIKDLSISSLNNYFAMSCANMEDVLIYVSKY